MNINDFYIVLYYMETHRQDTEIMTIDIDNDNGLLEGNVIANEVIKPKSPKNNPKKSYKKRVHEHELNYDNFVKHNLQLTSYLIGDLKKACKTCKEKITGTKPVLIDRFNTKYLTITMCIKIK